VEAGEGCRPGCATWQREKERGASTLGQQPDHGVEMAPGGTVGGGSVRSWWRRAGEQGRVVGRSRRSVGTADRGGTATWPGGQRRGAEEDGREKPSGDRAPIGGLGWHSAGRRGFIPDLKHNPNSNFSN
jgi:hypothetical protein